MTVKKYSATSMRDAIAMVKKELGEDALIISTKRLPRASNDPYKADIFQIEAMSSEDGDKKNTKAVLPDKEEKIDIQGFDNISGSTGWESLQNELGAIKEILYSVNHSEVFSELLQTYPGVFNIYAKFIKSGISEKRAQMLITQSFADSDNIETSEYSKLVFKKLMSVVKVQLPFYNNDIANDRLITFVGPTGVGKTTTIAKLAAKLHLEKKKRVGLISIDNYRIGAFEQLKTYSAIIGLPCIPAFTKDDLSKAINKLGNVDYILVDTAGQSHLDRSRLSELRDIINPGHNFTVQLVVSAATGRLDMKEIVESYKMLNPSSYVFSKVDETKRRGGILDQIIEYKLPVSFITNGQEVPEDLLVATEKGILNLLLNNEVT